VTDAAIAPEPLDSALRHAVARSFNRITVDGDMSTNDTVLLMANGTAGNPSITSTDSDQYRDFERALTQVATTLAQAIVRDGEGATKFVEIGVKGAISRDDALLAARSVANSSLVKTALFGEDANWGRVLAAVGYSGAEVDPDRVSLWFGDQHLVEGGQPLPLDEEKAKGVLSHTDVSISIDLGLGDGEATVWTSDLSYDYVKINAHYRT
jgi:glutamate N-acetyltransferase/amino-acid N-acetyltransferase